MSIDNNIDQYHTKQGAVGIGTKSRTIIMGLLIFSILAGVSVAIGFLTKVIPLIFLPVGFLWLISKRKYLETISFSLSSLGVAGSFIAYLWLKYENFKSLGLGWQVIRDDKSFSFYYYVFQMEFVPGLILLGVVMILVSSLIIYFI